MNIQAIMFIIKKLKDFGTIETDKETIKTVNYLADHSLDCLYYFEDISCSNCTDCSHLSYKDCHYMYYSNLETELTEIINCAIPIGLTEDCIHSILLNITEYNLETLINAINQSKITILDNNKMTAETVRNLLKKTANNLDLIILDNYIKLNWTS